MRELKARGGIRLEPKDYEVKDGDIVHIRSASDDARRAAAGR